MRRPRVRFYVRRFLIWLCTAAFLLTVWLGNFARDVHTTAQASDDEQQLVQTGVNYSNQAIL